MPSARKITLVCLPNKPIQGPTCPPDAAGPQHRRLTLGPDLYDTISLGRASDHPEKTDREPLKENALFKCRVVSKEHAEIGWWNEKHLYIQDLKSLHGTYVNNELLPSCTKLPLNHNDIVQLGISFRSDKGWVNPVRMRVEFDDQEERLKTVEASFDQTSFELEDAYNEILSRIKISTIESIETSDSETRSESEVETESRSDNERDTSPSEQEDDILHEPARFEEKSDYNNVAIAVDEATDPASTTLGSCPESLATQNTTVLSSLEIADMEVPGEVSVLRDLAISLKAFTQIHQDMPRDVKSAIMVIIEKMDTAVYLERERYPDSQVPEESDLSDLVLIVQQLKDELGCPVAQGGSGERTASSAKRKIEDISDGEDIIEIDNSFGTMDQSFDMSEEHMSNEFDVNSLMGGATSRKARKIYDTSPGRSEQIFVTQNSNDMHEHPRTLTKVTGAIKGATRAAGLFAGGVLAGGAAMAGYLASLAE